MTPKEKILDTCTRVISEMESQTAALVIGRILDLEREAIKGYEDLDEKQTQLDVTLQDRDNRRRRMDIAKVILDETQVCDLDRIAEIIWPVPSVETCNEEILGWGLNCELLHGHPGPHYNSGMSQRPSDATRIFNPSTEPVASDPTQVPTPDHICVVQLDSERRLLSSFCAKCGKHVADVAWATQAPTQETCGYKEQLGSRLWKCTRSKGHSDHHHLDDGHDLSSVSRPDYCTPNGVRTDGYLPTAEPCTAFLELQSAEGDIQRFNCVLTMPHIGCDHTDAHGRRW